MLLIRKHGLLLSNGRTAIGCFSCARDWCADGRTALQVACAAGQTIARKLTRASHAPLSPVFTAGHVACIQTLLQPTAIELSGKSFAWTGPRKVMQCDYCSVTQPISRFGCNCGHRNLPERDNQLSQQSTWAGLDHRDKVGYTARCIAVELGFFEGVKELDRYRALNADPARYALDPRVAA